MKKVQRRFWILSNALISAILALIGFSSCSETLDEYGTPSADFKVMGNVSSKSNQQSIPGIRVVMNRDTVHTGADGNYVIIDKGAFPTNQTYEISFEDIDGTLNGSFMKYDTIVEFEDPQFSGGNDSWYDGETAQTMNIQMEPEE